MKRLKKLGLKRLGGRRGFTLIELLIVVVIISILASVVALSAGGLVDRARQVAYGEAKTQIQNAAVAYLISAEGFPVTGNTTTIDGDTYSIIDICELIEPEEMLAGVPDGCWQGDGEGDDNCDGAGNVSCTGCEATAHYVWAIGSKGNVVSECKNTDDNDGGCINTSSDGYQGVWP